MTPERWLPIADSDGCEVSDMGNVRRGGKELPQSTCGAYAMVFVRSADGHVRRVHRLVLETFTGPCPPGMECRHIDGDRTNNRLDNLAWGSRQENSADKIRHGTYGRKLTLDQVELIRAQRRAGEKPKALADALPATDLATGVPEKSVANSCSRGCGRSSAGPRPRHPIRHGRRSRHRGVAMTPLPPLLEPLLQPRPNPSGPDAQHHRHGERDGDDQPDRQHAPEPELRPGLHLTRHGHLPAEGTAP